MRWLRRQLTRRLRKVRGTWQFWPLEDYADDERIMRRIEERGW